MKEQIQSIENFYEKPKKFRFQIEILNYLFDKKIIESDYFEEHFEEEDNIMSALDHLMSENLVRKTTFFPEKFAGFSIFIKSLIFINKCRFIIK